MKKLLLLWLLAGSAWAAPFDLYMNQMSPDGTGYLNRQLTVPNGGAGVDGMLIYSGTNSLPMVATFASGCSITFGVFNCTGAAQVNADWNSVSGVSQILNKPTALSAFTNDSGFITSSALSPYALTSALTAGLATKFNNPAGTTAQYLRGDGSLATFPSIPAAQVQSDWNAVSGLGVILNKPVIPAAQVNSDWNAVSGVSQILNKPTLTSGTVTSVGLTSSNLTVTGSPITSSGTLTVALPNTGTPGTYSGVTTDAQGRVISGTTPSQSAQTRALNSAFQINAGRGALVFYSVRIATTASIGGNQDGEVVLEIASDSGFTTNVQTLSISQNAQALTLAITLQSVQTSTTVVSGYVPAGYYTRLRTVSTTGSPVFTYRTGQEVLM